MSDPRRRGRGRSGRGGRIPRRGEGGAPATFLDETFVSFPHLEDPIRVSPGVSIEALAETVGARLARDQALGTELAAHATSSVQALGSVLSEQSSKLAAEFTSRGGTVPAPPEDGPAATSGADLSGRIAASVLEWETISRAAAGLGDRGLLELIQAVVAERKEANRVATAQLQWNELERCFLEME